MGVLAGTALAVLGGGCAVVPAMPWDRDPAAWQLYDAESVTPKTTDLTIGVTRLGCNSGVTGKVFEPEISYEQTRILIKPDVEAVRVFAAACPTKDFVRVRVELREPIGRRELVDAGCLNKDVAPEIDCATPARWKPR